MDWTVVGACLALVGISVVLGVMAFRNDRRFALPLVGLGLVGGLLLLGFGPASISDAKVESKWTVADLAREPDLYRRWLAEQELWGEPVGNVTMHQGFVRYPFRFLVVERNRDASDANWSIQPSNTVQELMRLWGVAEEEHPSEPLGVTRYFEANRRRGIDPLWAYGVLLTSPSKKDDRTCWLLFQKGGLTWPCESTDEDPDPAAIERLSVGALWWQFVGSPPEPRHLSPWTPSRLFILAGDSTLLLVVAVAAALAGRRNLATAPW